MTDFWINPPKPDPSRKGIAAVLIAKNESRYLWDWLTFHTLAGIDHFIIYHNESSDGSEEIITKFAQSQTQAKVTQIPWVLSMYSHREKRLFQTQNLAYAHATCTFGKMFKRMTFIDVDEYLVPQPGLSIADSIPDHPQVSLPWVMFGHNGHENYPGIADPFAYTQKTVSQDPILSYDKCIVDPCQVVRVGVHKFTTQSLGKNKSPALILNDKPALQLNHYFLRSAQEMVVKLERGTACKIDLTRRKAKILKQRALIEQDAEQDLAILKYLASHGINSSDQLRAHFS